MSAADVSAPALAGVAGGHPPCLPSLYRDKSAALKIVPARVALGSDEWLRVKERVRLCKRPESPHWIGAVDSLGELDPWMRPDDCGYRWCDDCVEETVTQAILLLDAIRKVEGERALAVLLFTYPRCAHEECKWLAWYRCLADVARWRNAMRHEYGLTAIPFVATVEEHVSGWPHVHMVARLLPTKTRWIKVWRKEKWVDREVAWGAELRRARKLWKDIAGGWTCFWEVCMSRPDYIAKYLTVLSQLPEETQAFLYRNRRRLYSKSNGLGPDPEPKSRWLVTRGSPSRVAAATGHCLTVQWGTGRVTRTQQLPELGHGAPDTLDRCLGADPSMAQDRI